MFRKFKKNVSITIVYIFLFYKLKRIIMNIFINVSLIFIKGIEI